MIPLTSKISNTGMPDCPTKQPAAASDTSESVKWSFELWLPSLLCGWCSEPWFPSPAISQKLVCLNALQSNQQQILGMQSFLCKWCWEPWFPSQVVSQILCVQNMLQSHGILSNTLAQTLTIASNVAMLANLAGTHIPRSRICSSRYCMMLHLGKNLPKTLAQRLMIAWITGPMLASSERYTNAAVMYMH